MVPRKFEFALALEPYPLRPGEVEAASGEAGLIRTASTRVYPTPYPPYSRRLRKQIGGYSGAVGIKIKVPHLERAALQTAWASKKLHGPLHVHGGSYRQRCTRLARPGPELRRLRRAARPDVDALYRQQAEGDLSAASASHAASDSSSCSTSA